MATFREQSGRWQAIIRRHSYARVAETFDTKTEAKAWARKIEAAMDDGSYIDAVTLNYRTVGDFITTYIDHFHPIKPFARSKLSALDMCRREFGRYTVRNLTVDKLLKFARERRGEVSQSTLSKQMYIFARALDDVAALSSLKFDNPVRQVLPLLDSYDLTGESRKRDRRVTSDELDLLLSSDDWVIDYFKLALGTGMRQGELHKLEWGDIDFDAKTITVRDAKHPTRKIGNTRVIPMFPSAESVLQNLHTYRPPGDVRVFTHPKLAASVSDRFAKLTRRLGIQNLVFHDTRHEAISRFFEVGMAVQEVAHISGHSDWGQLKRYTNLKAATIGVKYREDL